MSVLGNSLLLGAEAAGPTAYQVSRSLRFNSADSAYLSRTPASAGNRKTWTWSGWVKRGKLGISATLFASRPTSSPLAIFYFSDQDYLRFDTNSNSFGSVQTNAVFRDCSAWYHIVFAADSTQSTDANRLKLYVNGVQQTFASATYPSQNTDGQINTATLHGIGAINPSTYTDYFDGYLADIWFLDGIAATPSDFAETDATTGQWIPKTYSGSKGSNGFHLEFADNSAATAAALGKDTSGNGLNWTPNNFSVTAGAGNDSLTDTPTSYGTDDPAGATVRGNYCTLNPLDNGGLTLVEGNLGFSLASAGDWRTARGTFFVTSGKWYWEVTANTYVAGGVPWGFGIADATASLTTDIGANAGGWVYQSNGLKKNNGSTGSYGSSWTSGDVIGVALDMDNGTVAFYKNGVSQGTAYSSGLAGKAISPIVGLYPAETSGTAYCNFGQRPFAYQTAGTNRPASTYKALVDTNLPSPSVAKPSTVMDVLLWSGDATSPRTFSSLNFSPDFVWMRPRNYARSPIIYDAIRGAGNKLSPNLTEFEDTSTGRGYLSAFTSTGFTVADGSAGREDVNSSGYTYVAWAWDAGSSTVTDNTGSIQSTRRANATAGFSVVGWSSTSGVAHTVGHGLGVAPSMIIVKSRDLDRNWHVGHASLGWTKTLYLQLTNAADTNAAYWNDTAPTSTVFSIGNTGQLGGNNIAYCFAPVAGYSSAFSYSGNGSSDGPFCFLGFRPRFLIIKRTDAAYGWYMYDTARDTYNIAGKELLANVSDAEVSDTDLDILSNGFKPRRSSLAFNASGGTFIGFAWAESPFQYARAR